MSRKGKSTSTTSGSSKRVKGNVSSTGEKIYHGQGSTYYDRTKINPKKGDQLFSSQQAAERAGFRKSKR